MYARDGLAPEKDCFFHSEMDLLVTNCWPRAKSCTLHLNTACRFLGNSCSEFLGPRKLVELSKMSTGNVEKITIFNHPFLESVIDRGLSRCNGTCIKISTRICCNQIKKYSRKGKTQEKDKNLFPVEQLPKQNVGPDSQSSGTADNQDENEIFSSNTTEIKTSVIAPSRNDVLRACTITCGLIGALGVLIRQASHIASGEGWPLNDCSADVTFGFELWHLELVVGSVLLVSSTRFLLLKIWPDFAESSEAANRLVLTSLEPLDYLFVAFLPGISEEFLFRGALLPLFGVNWTSILAVAALFGILHLGGGRNYSFAIWATFVGLVYGYATLLTSSATVPMASHALNNLVGGIIWRYQRGWEEST